MPTATAPRLTVDEAAQAARRHPVTLYRALESGRLHGAQNVKGGRWLIRETCLDAWLEGHPCEHRANVHPINRRRTA